MVRLLGFAETSENLVSQAAMPGWLTCGSLQLVAVTALASYPTRFSYGAPTQE